MTTAVDVTLIKARRKAWAYFEDIAGEFAPPEPFPMETDWHAIWTGMWAAVARSFGAGETGAALVAQAAWDRYATTSVVEANAAEIVSFIERTVRA